MEIVDMILLSIGIGLNVFATAQKLGATQAKLRKGQVLGLCAAFGLLETAMLLIGIGCSMLIPFSEYMRKLFILILVVIGGNMVRLSVVQKYQEESRAEELHVPKLLRTVVWTELKTIMLGFCFWWSGGNPWLCAALIWLVTAMLAAMGFAQGYMMGFRLYRLVNALGGVVIVLAVIRLYFRLT